MTFAPEALLVAAVVGVGILHTIVPDHWVPITLIARQHGWSRAETAQAALKAGTGHVLSTLLIGLVVWIAGVAFATRFGTYVSIASSLALIGFGGWIALASLREMRSGHGHGHGHGHSHDHELLTVTAAGKTETYTTRFAEHADGDAGHGHVHGADDADALYKPLHAGAAALTHTHRHRHGNGQPHLHRHDHDAATWHREALDPDAEPPLHEHRHKTSSRTALLLILGSSPMVEGIPAFFAAGKYGFGLIAVMAVAFGISTIATYVVLCVYSTAGLQRVKLGSFEKYGEVISGAFIALVGFVFLAFPVL